MAGRMTDLERAVACTAAVTAALVAMRAGNKAAANGLLAHAAHAGVQPSELMAEVAAQTGGTL